MAHPGKEVHDRIQDPNYYIDDGNIVILVETTLFKVEYDSPFDPIILTNYYSPRSTNLCS